jgi:hypothetical protein
VPSVNTLVCEKRQRFDRAADGTECRPYRSKQFELAGIVI